MADLRLRALERQAAQGDTQAQARLLVERTRVGDTTRSQLEILGILGHHPAILALGDWRPKLAKPARPLMWMNEAKAESIARYNPQRMCTDVIVRIGSNKAVVSIPDEKKVLSQKNLRIKTLREAIQKLRPMLYLRGVLPPGDMALALPPGQEDWVRLAWAAAHFILCQWEEQTACQEGLEELTAEGPDDRVEQIPPNGDYLSEAGMRKFGIPLAPRRLLDLIQEWRGWRNHTQPPDRDKLIDEIQDSEIVDDCVALLGSDEGGLHSGPAAVLQALTMILGVGYVWPESKLKSRDLLKHLFARGAYDAGQIYELTKKNAGRWFAREVLLADALAWIGE